MSEQKAARGLLSIGLAGLAALTVLTIWIGPHSIGRLQGRVDAAANAALDAAGIEWADATAHGQSVALEGVAPTDAEMAQAVTAVKAAQGVGSVSTLAVEIAPVAAPYSITARKNATGVALIGVAPNRSSLKAILDAAGALYGEGLKTDLRLASGAPKGVTWDVAAIQALDALSRLDEGLVRLENATLRLEGLAPSDVVIAEIRDKLSRPSQGVSVTLDVLSREAMARSGDTRLVECNNAFARFASRNRIAFAPQTARLTQQGNQTVERLVEIARGCSAFRIEIQGHTDSTGQEEVNLKLSQQRAEAVKAYLAMRGIPADRLVAIGYGQTKPMASNRTERGRAANRRIEFKLSPAEQR